MTSLKDFHTPTIEKEPDAAKKLLRKLFRENQERIETMKELVSALEAQQTRLRLIVGVVKY